MYWPSSASSRYQRVSEIRAHLMNKQFPVYQKKALLIDRPLWCTYWRSCRHSSEIYHHSWVRIKKLSDRTRLYPVPTVYSQFLKKAQVSFILHSESQQIKINHCLISQAEKEDDETWQKAERVQNALPHQSSMNLSPNTTCNNDKCLYKVTDYTVLSVVNQWGS